MCRVITNKCQTLPGSAAQKWLLAMLGNLILGDVAHSHMGKFGGYCPLKNFLEKKESIFPERCKKRMKNIISAKKTILFMVLADF